MAASPAPSPSGFKFPPDWGAFWGAVAVVLLLGGTAIVAIRRSYQTPTTLFNQYSDRRTRAKAAIEANRVVPELAKLIHQVMAPAFVEQQAITRDGIEARLQSVDYLEALRRLSEHYGDYADLDRLWNDAIRWAHLKGWGALIFLVGLAVVTVWFLFAGFILPAWLILVGIGGVVGCTVSTISWLQEHATYNAMTAIFAKYA